MCELTTDIPLVSRLKKNVADPGPGTILSDIPRTVPLNSLQGLISLGPFSHIPGILLIQETPLTLQGRIILDIKANFCIFSMLERESNVQILKIIGQFRHDMVSNVQRSYVKVCLKTTD